MPSLIDLYQIADICEAQLHCPVSLETLKRRWPTLQFSLAYEDEMDELTPIYESDRYLWYWYAQGTGIGCGRLVEEAERATGVLLVVKEVEMVAERSVA